MQSEIVCNSTPLISLIKISSLEIIKEVFKTIIIPHKVYEEIERGKNKKQYQDLSSLSWINIV